ncbi:transporter, cation channel family protein [Treponema socranskii subsp. socranskii VPI DR56BR1116 = ATCC 35536]|uniref:Transporter, cation channel family protein n=1 Tax=Treponema socranskii subsp. socranskii VPI DR56BR1116 = ATCC 35536 TaxID=1125725 RepID=U2LLJ0_TRESO|nr:ion transporter [Treponema socranskii]ERF61724.1 transporter, cation channel family protein [Treponema socranskii subsp. socranskii VPI DR56BR1116 = ATCC 35536]ERK05091.1 transporter, cation channel family protein [Treponema socranskii subsp. socranskii VPI DR56BR1116 = ATCC 35536]
MTTYAKIKKRTFEIIEKGGHGDTPSKVFDIFIMILICLNVLSVFVETFTISNTMRKILADIELFSIIIFSVEFILRVWTADFLYKNLSPVKAKIRYVFSFMALIDLFAILPFYIPFVIKVDLRVLRILRLFRLSRIIKANRYTKSLQKVMRVISEKSAELFSAVLMLFILMLISSVLIYYIESPAQPDVYKNALSGLWWSIAIFTSVWLGDIYPITATGKILCALMAIFGVAIIAVPTGIISSGFVEDNSESADKQIELLKEIKKEIDELKNKSKSEN